MARLIAGVGFGGLAAAKRLAKQPVEVTVIDKRNYHLFQPLLYQVATAAFSPPRYVLESVYCLRSSALKSL
jgi:NADH dehydrogenase FAD-containing subunit